MEVSKIKEQEVLFGIEMLSDEEVRRIQGGETILGETVLYWIAYYSGRAVHSVSQAAEERPNDPYTYSQTYKMGSF